MLADTSQSLLDRLRTRNTTSDWQSFVDIYSPFIKRQLIRCQIDDRDAEDLCQETLTQVFKAIPKFEHNGRVGAFRAWMKKIVRQKISTFIRSRQMGPNRTVTGEHLEERVVDEHWQYLWDQEHDRYVVNHLLQMIRSEFTETTWNSFRRLVIEEQEPSAVAETLQVSVNAVLIAKSRIMKRLRELGQGLVDPF